MAAALSARRRGRPAIVGINVTPMVDVVLVLLVIMMVSATYIVSQALKVELPRTATSDESVNRSYVVIIDKDGAYRFNGEGVDFEQLKARLQAAHAESKDANLVITADRAALHGNVVGVIDAAKLAGISKFAINVERSK